MQATEEEIEQFKSGNEFLQFGATNLGQRYSSLALEGNFGARPSEFAEMLNSIIAISLAGPDHPMAINARLAIALQGSKVQWGLRGHNMLNEDIAEVRYFLENAAEEFGQEKERRALVRRYRNLFDEAYRRRPRGPRHGDNKKK